MQKLLYVLKFGVMFGKTDTETGWTYNESTLVAFTLLEFLNINDEITNY